MARLPMFAIFDTKADAFLPPFISTTRGEAIRTFGDVMRDTSLPFVKHVSDYHLYYVGEYDNLGGTVQGLGKPERVIAGDEIGGSNGI